MQYWPPNTEKIEDYGGIHVRVQKDEELANFHIRTLLIYKVNEKEVRTKTNKNAPIPTLLVIGVESLCEQFHICAKFNKFLRVSPKCTYAIQ